MDKTFWCTYAHVTVISALLVQRRVHNNTGFQTFRHPAASFMYSLYPPMQSIATIRLSLRLTDMKDAELCNYSPAPPLHSGVYWPTMLDLNAVMAWNTTYLVRQLQSTG